MQSVTIAQHATNILDAWKQQDQTGLGAALESASTSRLSRHMAAEWESEQGEVLESIVDHLRELASRDALPKTDGRSGAMALLAHLSVNRGGKTLEENFSNSVIN